MYVTINTKFEVKVFCSNCRYTGFKYFDKGTIVPYFMECPNCECDTLRKA